MEKKEKLKYSIMVGFIVLIIVIGNIIGAVRSKQYQLVLGTEQVVVYVLCIVVAMISVYFINRKR